MLWGTLNRDEFDRCEYCGYNKIKQDKEGLNSTNKIAKTIKVGEIDKTKIGKD